MLFKARLELFESNEVSVKYEFVLGLKELLLKSISQTNIDKKEKKQTNKQKRRKKSKPSLLRLTQT